MVEKNASFTGSFDSECQTQSVPRTLLVLVAMIHEGPSIKSQSGFSGNVFSQATLSVAQQLQYNSSVRRGSESSGVRHNNARETPLAIYVGATIHEKTRKRQLVDKMFKLGLSISYDCVMEISTGQGNRACKQYEQEKTVCPRNLRLGLNTKEVIDNLTTIQALLQSWIPFMELEYPCSSRSQKAIQAQFALISAHWKCQLPRRYQNCQTATLVYLQ